MMRTCLCSSVLALAVCALACGFGGKSPTSAPAPKVEAKPVGRVGLTQILREYNDPKVKVNRAALADKYFEKYWEIDLTDQRFHVEEDHIVASVMFFEKFSTCLYFRDKNDLLKFGPDGKSGPKVVVGKAVSDGQFDDCFIP